MKELNNDLHKSQSEPKLSAITNLETNSLRASPSTIINTGGGGSQDNLDASSQDIPQLRTPRLVIDRPVWTVSECYQIGSDESGLIPGFSTKLGGGDLASLGGVSSVTGGPDEVKKKKVLHEAGAQLKKKLSKTRRNICTSDKILRIVISLFPCIGWMKTYKIKEYLVCDIISGITSAIFHVPQGMANALANAVAPVYGLYGSFFPSAVYSVMGTSMQCSVGTFTVVSIITANAVRRLATVESGELLVAPQPTHQPGWLDSGNNDTFYYYSNDTTTATPGVVGPIAGGGKIITPIQVTVAVTLMSGIIQVLMGILRCGRLGILISPSLASGFMTGCAVQIIASQLKGCFNLKFKDFTGVFGVINTLIAVVENIGDANMITTIMSVCVCVMLIMGKDLAGPRFQKFARIPLPVDLIMVIICSIVSYYLELNHKYSVPIVNNIPKGLPKPVAPLAELLPKVIGDAIAVAIVGFASTFSMGKTFARRYNHEVDANQELLALGCGNILGGFFLCLPGCGSLARSSVMESVGCKTQLTGMISCVFLALVLYFIGPLLEPLPKCVLATILATALKGYLFNISEVKKLWNVSKADAIIWVTTCICVIVLDVTYGLMIGVIITLLSVTWRMQGYRGTLLREVKTSGIFLPNNKKKKVRLGPDQGRLILFRFGNPLCFATAGNFVADVKRIIKQLEQAKPRSNLNINGSMDLNSHSFLVVDLSSTCFVDNTGVEALQEGIEKCRKYNIEFSLAALPDNVLGTLQRSGILDVVGYDNIFPTIQDAVLACTNRINVVSYDSLSTSISFNMENTDNNNQDKGDGNNSLRVPGNGGDSPSSVQSDLGVRVKDIHVAEGSRTGSLSADEDDLEDDDYAKQVNFSISENGRTQRASIVSNAGGHIVRSSYL